MEDVDGDGMETAMLKAMMSGSDCLDTLASVNPMATDIAGDNMTKP